MHRAEVTRLVSTSVVDPKRCEPRSRWPSSDRQGPRAAGDAGVEEVSLQHGIMLGRNADYHGWIL
jgi:hypothetical protein